MTHRFAGSGYDQFEWPDMLVVDLLAEHYGATIRSNERMVLAKIHQHALCDLFAGDARRSKAWRDELTTYADAMGVDRKTTVQADRMVFWELLNLVKQRYRTSPRMRVTAAARLQQALGLLIQEVAPPKPVGTWAKRPVRARPFEVALA